MYFYWSCSGSVQAMGRRGVAAGSTSGRELCTAGRQRSSTADTMQAFVWQTKPLWNLSRGGTGRAMRPRRLSRWGLERQLRGIFVQPKGAGGYFNFEFNCGGALLSSYVMNPARVNGRLQEFVPLTAEDNQRIRLVASLPRALNRRSPDRRPGFWNSPCPLPCWNNMPGRSVWSGVRPGAPTFTNAATKPLIPTGCPGCRWPAGIFTIRPVSET